MHALVGGGGGGGVGLHCSSYPSERERVEMFCVLSETQLGPSLAHSSGRRLDYTFSLLLAVPPSGQTSLPSVETFSQRGQKERNKIM